MTISNGAITRQGNGQFAPGHKGGPGNPMVRKLAEHRMAVQASVSVEDIGEIMIGLVSKAKAGDLDAAREVLDRVLGKPAQVSVDVLVRMSELEALLMELQRRRTT